MINRILSSTSLNNRDYNTNFKGFGHYGASKLVSITGESSKQVHSIKSVFKEILGLVNGQKGLAAAIKKEVGNVDFNRDSAFFVSENKNIVLNFPKQEGGSPLFRMELIEENKPKETIILDANNYLVESIGKKQNKYYSPNKVNIDNIKNTIETIFNIADAELFKIRMFIRKQSLSQLPTSTYVPATTITRPQITKKVETKPVEQKLKPSEFVPLSKKSDSEKTVINYSIREIMKQDKSFVKEEKKPDLNLIEKRLKNFSNKKVKKQDSITKTEKESTGDELVKKK